MNLLAIILLLVAACGGRPALCVEGQSSPCACPTGASGAQMCRSGVFGPCSCIAKVDYGTGSFEAKLVVKMPVAGPRDVPTLEATVIGAGNHPMEAYSLVDVSTGVELKPTKMLGGRQGPEPLALAIVMNGWELWIGNDQEIPEIREDDPSRYPGVLLDLREAIDKLDFPSLGPAGSVGTIITYGVSAKVRVAMGPLSKITGRALGTQKDYFGDTGVEVVQGIRVALAELHKRSEPRKALIVIGDGNDTNNESAKSLLADLKKRAANDGVQTFAVIYKTRLSSEASVVPLMIPRAKLVTTTSGIALALADIVEKIDDRKYLTFPGYDVKARAGLAWDGHSHDLVIRVRTQASGVSAVLLPRWKAP